MCGSTLYHLLLLSNEQGRAKTSEVGGMAVKSGGVAAAAAQEAKGQKAAAAQQGAAGSTFYRFQQREKRRTGESCSIGIRASGAHVGDYVLQIIPRGVILMLSHYFHDLICLQSSWT